MIAQQARLFTDTINVGFSGGKDSLVTLDLCRRVFPKVHAFFMWTVAPDLGFQARYLDFMANKMGVNLIRLPHWSLGARLRYNYMRPGSKCTQDCCLLDISDIQAEVTRLTGCKWFAYGFSRYDSLERNAMLRRCGGLDLKGHYVYPVMNFTRWAIFSYLRQHRIPLPIDYYMFGHSFGRIGPLELPSIKARFPSDYEKIETYFPHAQAQITRATL
jgi:phosphoadenosine phosphosulfate reductase